MKEFDRKLILSAGRDGLMDRKTSAFPFGLDKSITLAVIPVEDPTDLYGLDRQSNQLIEAILRIPNIDTNGAEKILGRQRAIAIAFITTPNGRRTQIYGLAKNILTNDGGQISKALKRASDTAVDATPGVSWPSATYPLEYDKHCAYSSITDDYYKLEAVIIPHESLVRFTRNFSKGTRNAISAAAYVMGAYRETGLDVDEMITRSMLRGNLRHNVKPWNIY